MTRTTVALDLSRDTDFERWQSYVLARPDTHYTDLGQWRRIFGELYGLRLPTYRRLDFRASRRFDTRRGRVFLTLDLFNALGRENPQALDYDLFWFDPYRRAYGYGSQVEEQIPRLITFGLRWEF